MDRRFFEVGFMGSVIGMLATFEGIATVIATAVIAWFTVALASSTKRLWKETMKASTIAKISADAALKTAQNMEAVERAYVQMSHMPPGLEIKEDGLMCRVQVRVKNFGRTPARVSDELLNFLVLNKDEGLPTRPDYKILPGHEAPKGFLLPGDELFATEMFAIDLSMVKSGEQVLWLFGYVDYIDQFDGHHRAGYARFYTPDADSLARYHGNPEGYLKRNNLAYVTQKDYNYDSIRQHGEGNDWDEPPN